MKEQKSPFDYPLKKAKTCLGNNGGSTDRDRQQTDGRAERTTEAPFVRSKQVEEEPVRASSVRASVRVGWNSSASGHLRFVVRTGCLLSAAAGDQKIARGAPSVWIY